MAYNIRQNRKVVKEKNSGAGSRRTLSQHQNKGTVRRTPQKSPLGPVSPFSLLQMSNLLFVAFERSVRIAAGMLGELNT